MAPLSVFMIKIKKKNICQWGQKYQVHSNGKQVCFSNVLTPSASIALVLSMDLSENEFWVNLPLPHLLTYKCY